MSLSAIATAVSRARWAILAFGVVYFFSILVGAVMVHSGDEFALRYRDELVARARTSEPALAAFNQDDRFRAALYDFGANLGAGVTQTIAGLAIVIPYPIAAYQGWVGGIVSVNRDHTSRFAVPSEALYYISVLVLQLIPYSLAGGAGVNLGWACLWPPPYYQGAKFFWFPKEALRDVLRIYVLVIPLFFIAALVEFLLR